VNIVSRPALYALLNTLVAVAVVVGFALHKGVAHPLYVVLLFAICSSPIIEAKAINDRYALLALWSVFSFLMYGALDLRNLILGVEGQTIELDGVLDSAETVILLGAFLVHVTYRIACRPRSMARPGAQLKSWSELTLVWAGIALWIVSSRLSWEFSVNLVVERTAAATAASLASLGGVKVGMFMIARMAQPLSILILAYAQCRYKRPYMIPIVVGVVLYQLLYGFVIDTKGEALIGAILVVLTNLLTSGRVPKGWLALMLVIIAVSFPVLQANRVIRDERGVNPTKASQNLAQNLQQALQAKDRVNTGRERAQTVLERLTTKGSVELLVRGTGIVAPFQHGHTLTPMIAAFIPRLLWPDKPSIPTGQILNKDFHVSEGADTFISPSHIGELYWNFSWAGVVVGMTAFGLLLGTLGRKFDLAEAATITRLLVVVVTVRQIILGSEGEIATQYVVWMRSLLGIGVLHWTLARRPWVALPDQIADPSPASDVVPRASASPLFPNLLR
jgi:hypothetical protein